MLYVKIIEIKENIINSWTRTNKGSRKEHTVVNSVNSYLKMKSFSVNQKDYQDLFDCYDLFREIERNMIFYQTPELKEVYLAAKTDLFDNKFMPYLTKDVRDVINEHRALFDELLSTTPQDNKPITLNRLVDIAHDLENKDVDIKIDILHALLTAYHPDTGINHSLKMKTELVKIAQGSLGLSDKQTLLLERASLIHDIGKLFASREMFLDNTINYRFISDDDPVKQRFLQTQRDHTNDGDIILEFFKLPGDIKQYLNIYANFQIFALLHHEEINKTGYFGLEGDNIPYEVQVLNILDKFNAMSQKRPYKEAADKTTIIKYFQEQIERGKIAENFKKLISALLEMIPR